jgi:hypothetical protein
MIRRRLIGQQRRDLRAQHWFGSRYAEFGGVLSGEQRGARNVTSTAADLVAQAGDTAEAGNEEGCMQKVAQARDLLGID